MALVAVESLYRSCLLALDGPLMTAIAAQLSVSEEEDRWPDVRILRAYLKLAPAVVLHDLLDALLSRTELAPSVRYCGLRILLRPDVTSLNVGIFPEAFHRRVVNCLGELGAGLNSLDLKGVWLRDDVLGDFCKVIAKMSDLRALGIPHIATDELLKTISENCPKLRLLDVSGETQLSRYGLEAIVANLWSSLQVIDIGNLAEVNIDPADIAFLVKSLPNIVSLGTYAHIGKALCLLLEEGWSGKSKIQYLHDIGTNSKAINAIKLLCPDLQSIYLDGMEKGVVLDLQHFAKLTEIKLHIFDCEELFSLMRDSGENIESLELLFGSGTLDLSRLSSLCRKLSKLECYFMTCSASTSMSWPNLKIVRIFHSDINTPTVISLALSSPSLARLGIGSALELADCDVCDLCGPELQEVWLADAYQLTQDAVLCFITGCPKLVSLGELSGWDISSEQIEELKQLCTHSNLDLSLWFYPSSNRE